MQRLSTIVTLLTLASAVVCGVDDLPIKPPPSPDPTVRVIYAIPTDRKRNPSYISVVRDAIHHVQVWYAAQLNGYTFSLYDPIPEVCTLPHPGDYYAREGGWDRVIRDLQDCVPVEHSSPYYVWAIYPDVPAHYEETELGAGGGGVTILHRDDLDGLVIPETHEAGGSPPRGSHGWIGGLAHELGHAFGLPHPPGCDEGWNGCDADALMWAGYAYDYPDTYLTEADKLTLLGSPFFQYRQ